MHYKKPSHGNYRGKQKPKRQDQKQGYNQPALKNANEEFFKQLEKDFSQIAEEKLRELSTASDKKITTNQIRNILALINNINQKINLSGEQLSSSIQNDIQYLLVRIYYNCGKESVVKTFVDKTKLIEALLCVGASKSKWELFSKYMEALVAFHRYYGGKDN